MLSQPEQENLKQIERHLQETDPELANRLRGDRVAAKRGRTLRVTLYTLSGVLVLVGAIMSVFPIVFLGLLVAGGAATLHVTNVRKRRMWTDQAQDSEGG